MKRKSEKTKDKSYAEKKTEKPTRKSRRYSRRRKRSASSSAERDESGAEDNEMSVGNSQEDTEEEVPLTASAEVGAVITAEDNSEDEGKRTRRSSKSDSNEQTAKVENAEEEWKEDNQFWEEGDPPSESGDQKHKEKEGKSDIWKVKNPNGGGGQLKLCIVRPQEPAERSPRRRKRLSRTPSSHQKEARESGEDIEPEKRTSRESSEEKQTGSADEQVQKGDECNEMEKGSEDSQVNEVSSNVQDSAVETEMKTVEIPLPEGQPVSVQEFKNPSIPSETKEDVNETKEDVNETKEDVNETKEDVNNAEIKDESKTTSEVAGSENEGNTVERQECGNGGDKSVEDINSEKEKQTVSEEPKSPSSEAGGKEEGEVQDDDDDDNTKEDRTSGQGRGSSEEKVQEQSPLRESNKSTIPVSNKCSEASNSKEKDSGRKSRESSSSPDDCRGRTKSKDSTSRNHNSEARSSRSEGRRRSRPRDTRRKSPESRSVSKHRRKYSRSKSHSPEQRKEKVSLRRSFSTRNDGENKCCEEKSEPKEQKEDKENQGKKNSEVANDAGQEPSTIVPRKRRWGQRNSSRPSKKPVLSISTDSLKNLIPGAKPVPIGEVQLTPDEDNRREKEMKESDKDDREKSRERDSQERGSDKKVVMLPDAPRLSVAVTDDRGQAVTRQISIVSDDARLLQRSPSPPRHKVSNVLFITNLVRPFTVNQLKELLARTGTIIEGGFWIDKIKSKCYVEYEKESEARETRHALHGVRWPVSNPKQLCVDFGKKEDMELAQMLAETDQIPRKTEPLKMDRSVEGWVADQAREKELEREQREREKEREQRERERERIRVKDRAHQVPLEALEHGRNSKLSASVREWDLGKIGQISPSERERDIRYETDRSRERERKVRKEKGHRSRSPSVTEVSARKSKKKEEDAPAKLLDDLFRKTKTTPCIYWLPLTAEQIVVKEEMRRKHMAEHERRVAEMRKAERERERIRSQQRQQRRTGERDKRRRRSGSGSPKK